MSTEDDDAEAVDVNVAVTYANEAPEAGSPKIVANMESLSRSHSLRAPRRQRDLRSTAILRSASGTKLDTLNNAPIVDDTTNHHQDIIHSDSRNQLHPNPGVPVASLPVPRDTFNMNQGTVWKFHDFYITQILREINSVDFRSAISGLLALLEALNFDFYEFLHFLKAKFYQINKIHSP